MKYTAKPVLIEAVFLDGIKTLLDFLQVGEFSAIMRDGAYLVVEHGTIHVPFGECYIIRWPHGIDVMDKDEFESMYEEAN